MDLQDILRLAQSGARGFTTGLLGAPVDIANMAMGGVGGQKPVMGSEWIGDKLQGAGLLAPPATDLPNEITEFAGGLLNPGAPLKAGLLAKDPAIAMALIRGFHGSGKDFKAFDLAAEKTTGGGLNKHGVSISPDPKVASRYATDFNPNGGAVVYPVEADLNKTLNLSAAEFNRLQQLVHKIDDGHPLSELEDIGLEMLLKKAGIKYEGQHPIQAIKDAGYDSLAGDAGRFGAAEREMLVFDPDKVKFSLGK